MAQKKLINMTVVRVNVSEKSMNRRRKLAEFVEITFDADKVSSTRSKFNLTISRSPSLARSPHA